MNSLLGSQLLSGGDVELATGEALSGKAVCILYFSAHWCGPCRGFTPEFAEAYKEYKATGGSEAEVVFVSWDNSPEEFKEYFATMPWLALPFSQQRGRELGEKFHVEGIPSLVVLGQENAEVQDMKGLDARSLVHQHKAAAFPLTTTRIMELKSQQEKLAKSVLDELAGGKLFATVCAPGAETAEIPTSSVLEDCEYFLALLSDGDGSDSTYKNVANIVAAARGEGRRLGCLYLGWSLYNDDSDHKPLAKDYHAVLAVSEDVKAKLAKLTMTGIQPPHAFVFGVEDDGSLRLVQTDPGCQKIGQHGAMGYPWSDARIAELKAEREQRKEATRAKQVNLQFLKGSDGRDGLFSKDGVEVKVDDLAALGEDAVVGLYFSAHWCPPCRGFTPLLAKCYKELKEAGKKFEIVFVSSDRDEESFKEYMSEMPWVALPLSEKNLKEDLNGIFEIRGIPTLVLLKPDGTLLTANGREAVSCGSEFFPWGPEELERGRKRLEEEAARQRQAVLEAEAESLATQESRGGPILKRLIGAPGSVKHDVGAFTVAFQRFSTAGAPASIAKEGVLYYEIEVCDADGIPQVGFATADFNKAIIDEQSGDGVGDDTESWGVDGTRKLWWHGGSGEWACSWTQGDTIGLAANIELGKIAVSKNGNWMEEACGVVFNDEKIKAGVYPCMTGGNYTIRYNLDGKVHGAFKYAPPLMELWDKSST